MRETEEHGLQRSMKQTLALVLERAHCKYCSSQIRLQKDIVFDCTAYYSLTVTADHSCPVESHEHEKGGGREGMDSSERYSALDCWSLVSVQHILDLISPQQVQTSGSPDHSEQAICNCWTGLLDGTFFSFFFTATVGSTVVEKLAI